MNATGIICEYNPFHNGHLHHLLETKKMFKNNVIILVLSSHFTQRGNVSVLDKFEKTKIALKYGVDIVIELPFVFSTQNADKFAKGSLELLNCMKVNTLVFGSESNNIDNLIDTANKTLNNKQLEKDIKKHLDKGLSYPKSISNAYIDNNIASVETPNDILGICYIKEILKNNYLIKPITIKRTNDYHSKDITSNIISATATRKLLNEKKDIKNYVPALSNSYLKTYINSEDNYFKLLKYKIISSSEEELKNVQDVDEGLENRLKKYINKSFTLEEFIENIKTKRYTRNKITRMLTHILTNYTKKENEKNTNNTYIRILGFTKKGQKYLNKIKKDIELPILTNYKNIDDDILKTELKVTNIYEELTNKDLLKLETSKKTN